MQIKKGTKLKVHNPKKGETWCLFGVTFQDKVDNNYITVCYGTIFVNNFTQCGELKQGDFVFVEKVNSFDVKNFNGKPQITVSVDLQVDSDDYDTDVSTSDGLPPF
ncbi:MAG: hypothetical protein R3Y05_01480 [bacterium]